MAACYGEGFQQPIDYMTGKAIPGAPLVGVIRNGPGSRGAMVILQPVGDQERSPQVAEAPKSPPTNYY